MTGSMVESVHDAAGVRPMMHHHPLKMGAYGGGCGAGGGRGGNGGSVGGGGDGTGGRAGGSGGESGNGGSSCELSHSW